MGDGIGAKIGWGLALGLAVFVVYGKVRTPDPPPAATPAPVAATPTATPQPTPEPSPTPTPNIVDMLNSRFPATVAGRVQLPSANPTATAVVTSNPPPSENAPPAPTPLPEYRNTMDIERERAQSVITPVLERMATTARELTGLEGEWSQQCTGTTEVPFLDPYGIKVTGTMQKEDSPACRARKQRMSELKASLPKDNQEVQDLARRNSILPGILRELVAKYGLSAYVR